MKYWQNETPVKSNINCEKYRKNINLYEKAEIFSKIIFKKMITTHLDAGGARLSRTKLFYLR